MPVNLTPAHLRCSLGGCPSVTRLDDGRLAIIAPLAGETDNIPESIWEKRNADAGEALVVISPDLLANLPEILHLRSQVATLKQALEPFAKIEPSSFYPDDGSEEEGYTVILDGKAEDIGISSGPDFTGADLARARAALTEEDKEKCDSSPVEAPQTGEDTPGATSGSQDA